MARDPVHAAGGIVLRGGPRPRIAVVRRSKDDSWVLPRGKLKRDENPIAAAKREVMEETGHRVKVHEFLGAITYSARGRPKLVQYWRMKAAERPSRHLTEDITEVRWLPLTAAIRRLSFPLEKLFLRNVGRGALKRRARKAAKRKRARRTSRARKQRQSPSRKKRIARQPRSKPAARRAVTKQLAPPAVRKVAAATPSSRPALPPAPPPIARILPPAAARAPAVDSGFFRRILGRN
jgi:8-oxo-dGTP diphosphatase